LKERKVKDLLRGGFEENLKIKIWQK